MVAVKRRLVFSSFQMHTYIIAPVSVIVACIVSVPNYTYFVLQTPRAYYV